MSVKIPAVVNGSYINCENYVAGAQGSFNDVVLRVKLTGDWIIGGSATKSIVASFVDARGRTASAVIVLPGMAVPGEENTYDIPIPAAAKQYEGDISVVLSGYDQSISDSGYQEFSGDGSTTVFTITNVTPKPDVIDHVELDGITIAPSEYTYNSENGKVTFRAAPESGDTIKVVYNARVITQIARTANCFMRVLPSDFVIVDGSELETDIITQINAEIQALDGRVTTVEQEVDEFDADFNAKADKVALAVAGHLAGLDANGNLVDSGKAVTELVNNLTVFPIVYWRDNTPPHVGYEGDYWFAPTATKLFRTDDVNGTLEWVDVTEELLVPGNTFVKNDGQIFVYDELDGPLSPAKAVPMSHTHVKSDMVNFSNWVIDKADKVLAAVSGHFAGLDENGNLADSGKKAADFANASHTHTKSQITDLGLPTPTSADEGKILKVNSDGEWYLGGPKMSYKVKITVVGATSPYALYVQDNDSQEKYYTDGDTFSVHDLSTITCYASFASSNNWIKLNNSIVAGGIDAGEAEYTFAPNGDCEIELAGTAASYGHIDITMS